jgi:uncharacterized protein YggU (UPF0235/DUF167 family)
MDVSALKIVDVAGGARLEVRATPRAKKSGPKGVREGALELALAAPPVGGAANEELLRALAAILRVPRSAFRLVRGEAARRKLVEVGGVTAEELRERLAGLR